MGIVCVVRGPASSCPPHHEIGMRENLLLRAPRYFVYTSRPISRKSTSPGQHATFQGRVPLSGRLGPVMAVWQFHGKYTGTLSWRAGRLTGSSPPVVLSFSRYTITVPCRRQSSGGRKSYEECLQGPFSTVCSQTSHPTPLLPLSHSCCSSLGFVTNMYQSSSGLAYFHRHDILTGIICELSGCRRSCPPFHSYHKSFPTKGPLLRGSWPAMEPCITTITSL
jgi:hypothetical protein